MQYRNVLKFVSIIMLGMFAVKNPAISCPAEIPQAIITGNASLNAIQLGWSAKPTTLQIGNNQYTAFPKFEQVNQGNYPAGLTLGGSMVHNNIDNISCSPRNDQPTICDCKRKWHHDGLWEVRANIELH